MSISLFFVHLDVVFTRCHVVFVHCNVEQVVKEHKCVFFVIYEFLFFHLSLFCLYFPGLTFYVLEQRLEVEPSVESLILILRIYQFKEVFFVDILQLYVFLLLSLLRTRWYNSVPFKEAISGRI